VVQEDCYVLGRIIILRLYLLLLLHLRAAVQVGRMDLVAQVDVAQIKDNRQELAHHPAVMFKVNV